MQKGLPALISVVSVVQSCTRHALSNYAARQAMKKPWHAMSRSLMAGPPGWTDAFLHVAKSLLPRRSTCAAGPIERDSSYAGGGCCKLQQPWEIVRTKVADLTLPSLNKDRETLNTRVWRTLEAVAFQAANVPIRVQSLQCALLSIKRISRTMGPAAAGAACMGDCAHWLRGSYQGVLAAHPKVQVAATKVT
eukprot:799529-Amphidinium_carterae.1